MHALVWSDLPLYRRFEWFHPLYLQDVANNFTTSRYVDEVYWPQAKEINTKYSPPPL